MSVNKPSLQMATARYNSLLVDETLSTPMIRKGETFTRYLQRSEPVECYRNLNKTDLFSIRPRKGEFKGLVSGYARSIIVTDPCFHVNKAAVPRIRDKKNKEVHAYVRGNLFDCLDTPLNCNILKNAVRVSYNPYILDSFYLLNRDHNDEIDEDSICPIEDSLGYRYALIQDKDLLLFN